MHEYSTETLYSTHTHSCILTHLHTNTYNYVFAVPTAPQNFMLEVISPRELRASWDSPDPTNGLITNYTIRCSSFNALPFLATVMENVTSFILSRLSPFTNYSCNVSASTSAGEGPSSESMTAQTDEDG